MKRKHLLLIFAVLLVAALIVLVVALCNLFRLPVQMEGTTGNTGHTTSGQTDSTQSTQTTQTTQGEEGFTWEDCGDTVTITGYIGSASDLTVPETIEGKPVTQMAEGALTSHTNLRSIVIPGCVKSIVGAFENCTSLEEVSLAEGLENISNAFKGCTALRAVHIPASVTAVENAFVNCTALAEVTFGAERYCAEGTASMFNGCTALKTLDLPFGFSFDGYGCVSLEELTFRMDENSLELSGGPLNFGNFPALKKLTVLSSAGEVQLNTYETRVDTWTEYADDGSDWYQKLLSDAQKADSSGSFQSVDVTLEDGTPCQRIDSYLDSASGEYIPVATHVVEEGDGDRFNRISYYPALIGGVFGTPGVIRQYSAVTWFIEMYCPAVREDICGWECYADCRYNETVEINGITYELCLFME